MSYQAIICRLQNIRRHPKADRLNLAAVCGMQVIVSLDKKDGDLGIFFSDDGCLSPEMLRENNLYFTKRQKLITGGIFQEDQPLNKDPGKAGFFGIKGRVKAQNFMGERSYGFWIELESLSWTGVDLNTLKEGDTFTSLNGKVVCKKYINPATLKASKGGTQTKAAKKKIFPMLKEHKDTHQLRHYINQIPLGAILYVSLKTHGTSGRTGNIKGNPPLLGFKGEKLLNKWRWYWRKNFRWLKRIRFLSRIVSRFLNLAGRIINSLPKRTPTWQVVTGTRRVILDPNAGKEDGYYSGKTFRVDIHNKLKALDIPKNITLFYEICGFDETGREIMNSQPISKITDKKERKAVKKLYGETMTYSYGREQDALPSSERYGIYVYRATFTNEDGISWDLPWTQVKKICDEREIPTVPVLKGPFIYDGDTETLSQIISELEEGEDPIDSRHVREGIVLRVEYGKGISYYKSKGFLFKILEGIIKSDPNSIDIEEAESQEEEEVIE